MSSTRWGQRVKKTTSGSPTYFVYDEVGHLVGEYDNSGASIQENVWFGDTPVAVLKPNGGSEVNLFYIHTDHLGTPRRISRPGDNAIVWRWDSDPFGQCRRHRQLRLDLHHRQLLRPRRLRSGGCCH
jgi:uncharacterized protein RhaS with RHS repeats